MGGEVHLYSPDGPRRPPSIAATSSIMIALLSWPPSRLAENEQHVPPSARVQGSHRKSPEIRDAAGKAQASV